MYIEVGSAERPLEEKGHDRIVLFEDLGRFAVFDGAGQPVASDVAEKVFRKEHLDSAPPSLKEVFIRIQAGLMEYQESLSEEDQYMKGFILTTGAALGIDQETEKFQYAHAGDSAMYMLNHDSSTLSGVTRQEVIGHYADVENFLGHPRHILCQYGEAAISGDVSFVLFTDGVGDRANPRGAITPASIQKILASEDSPQYKAEQIINGSSINDDRAVIVVDCHQ